jgi:hypothetical protein
LTIVPVQALAAFDIRLAIVADMLLGGEGRKAG